MPGLSRRRSIAAIGALGIIGGARTVSAADLPADAASIDLARAKSEGRVMLYTSLDTQIVDNIAAAFKEKTGISVEYFRGGAADVTSKVLAEASAGRPQADLIDASDLAAILVMKDKGLLRPFRSEAIGAVSPQLRDPDGTWIADRLTQAVIQYNVKEFGAAPPKSWKDLAGDAMRSRLIYFSSTNGDGAPRIYTLAKAFGWDLLKAYASGKPMRVQTPQIITQMIESGERGVAFCTNDNIAWRSKRQGKPTDYAFPAEGVPTEPGAVAFPKTSARPHAAALFHEFWMGREGQAILAKGGKYSSGRERASAEPICHLRSRCCCFCCSSPIRSPG